jgi:hypothetical protein
MFERCLPTTITAIIANASCDSNPTEPTASKQLLKCASTGRETAAAIDPTETNLVTATVAKKIAVADKVTNGAKQKPTPAAVATPFPPRKPRNTG